MITIILIFVFFSGTTIFIGGLIAHLDRFPESEIKEEILHGIIAFGGGILLSAAVFFERVPYIQIVRSIPGLLLLAARAFP